MKWFCRHWYEFGLVPAAAALIFLIVGWSNLQVLQRVSLINFIGILLHQFEEYGFPGGAPVLMNKYMRGGTDRYPLNQFSAMLTNVLMPDTPGLAVWMDGHIGVYVGNGEVVEAQGTNEGVVKTQLRSRSWTKWLKIPNIEYESEESSDEGSQTESSRQTSTASRQESRSG